MELHAVKVQTGRYMSTWELRIRESGKVVGELIHNPSKGTYTALVRSRFTGLGRESHSGEDRAQVLAWAREMIVNEPAPSLESLDAEIAWFEAAEILSPDSEIFHVDVYTKGG